MEKKIEQLKMENRTLEELLKDLREKKNWTYMHIVDKLSQLGVNVDEKIVKKWEIGLNYPDIHIIYKLSELYSVPSESFIMAKENSYKKGLESVHIILVKWICYFTGISLKVLLIGSYVLIAIALIWAFMFFMEKAEPFYHD